MTELSSFTSGIYAKPSGSSFRIDDILVKNAGSTISHSQNPLSEFTNSTNEKFADLTNDPFSNLKKMLNNSEHKNLASQKIYSPTTKEEDKSAALNESMIRQNSSARLMSALSTLYDMSCYYPNINMYMNQNNKPVASFCDMNGDAMVAAATAALALSVDAQKSFGLFNSNPTNNYLTQAQSSPLLMSSNGSSLAEFNSKFHGASSDMPQSVKSGEVKHTIKLCRRRKARTVFSDQQLSGLEKRFESQKYLSTPERVELANNLGLSETQVSTK